MADSTPIEWTDATWNPITGCSVISPGCTNCYAMRLAGTRMKTHPSRAGLTVDSKAGPVWNGQVRLNEQWLTQPLQWNRPRMIFVCAHADLFHEAVPDEWIDRVFAIMALAPQHQFQVLTKRSRRMREYMEKSCGRIADRVMALRRETGIGKGNPVAPLPNGKLGSPWFPLSNVWLGVSAEDQRRADERIPDLLATPAAIRWLSAEPLLGELNLEPWLAPEVFCHGCDDGEGYGNRCSSRAIPRNEQCPYRYAVQIVTERGPFDEHGTPAHVDCEVRTLDWVVAGGESGPGARPMHPDWARSLRDQCAAAGVPFLFKQWGNWLPVCAMDEDQIDACYHPAPESHPDCTRREKIASVVLHKNGTALSGSARYSFGAYAQGSGAMMMWPVGKKAAGRLLDGIEHNALPAIESQQ